MAFRVARCELHHWEEPIISGSRGSGTVFFAGCTMKCKFCQNYQISRSHDTGILVDDEQLLSLFSSLEEEGAHNINLVTPSSWAKRLIPVLEKFKKISSLPIVYNTNAYENYDTLLSLDGLVDIYLPDLKYCDNDLAIAYSNAPRYFDIATKNIQEMIRQQPSNIIVDGIMQKGVLVRHLVLPTNSSDSIAVLDYLSTITPTPMVSIMAQYFPTNEVLSHPVLSKRVNQDEYERVLDYAEYIGLTDGFIQSPDSATEDYVPDFDYELVSKRLQNCKKSV